MRKVFLLRPLELFLRPSVAPALPLTISVVAQQTPSPIYRSSPLIEARAADLARMTLGEKASETHRETCEVYGIARRHYFF